MKEQRNKVIEMRHIVKDFDGFKANDDINLTLYQGEILALLGENGAGKSTLMRILSGLLEPTSGEILVNNQKVNIKDPTVAKKVRHWDGTPALHAYGFIYRFRKYYSRT